MGLQMLHFTFGRKRIGIRDVKFMHPFCICDEGERWATRAASCGAAPESARVRVEVGDCRPRHLSLSLRPIALSLRPSAARSSSSCKVKVTSDVLCYNRWGAVRQVQCLVESGRDTRLATITARAFIGDCATTCDIRPVKSS